MNKVLAWAQELKLLFPQNFKIIIMITAVIVEDELQSRNFLVKMVEDEFDAYEEKESNTNNKKPLY
jgi:hypothetical protein